jgi:hypothetical protein
VRENHAPCLSLPAILNTLMPVAASLAPSFTGFPHAFCSSSCSFDGGGRRTLDVVRSFELVAGCCSVRVRCDDSYGVPLGGGGTEFAINSAFESMSGRNALRFSVGTSLNSLGRRHASASCSSAMIAVVWIFEVRYYEDG